MTPKNKTALRAPTALAPIHRRAAGVDIGATFHVVAIPAELDAEPVRSFQSFTTERGIREGLAG